MPRKRVLRPERLRRVPAQFSWIDQRLVREGYLERCDVQALALYLLLVTVADAQGLSYYGDTTVCRLLSIPWLASTTSFGRDIYFFRVVCPLRWSTFSEPGAVSAGSLLFQVSSLSSSSSARRRRRSAACPAEGRAGVLSLHELVPAAAARCSLACAAARRSACSAL